MNSFDVPWGFVPGYHDYETNITDAQMESIIAKNHLHSGVINQFEYLGESIANGFNYSVSIETDDDDEFEVGRIWFLGTGRSECIG